MALFDEMHKEGKEPDTVEIVAQAGHIRPLDLIELSGQHTCLYYADFTDIIYKPSDSRIEITTRFHVVTLTGVHFSALYKALMAQRVLRITCTDERYKQLADPNKPTVYTMEIMRTSLQTLT